jgi:hypothetical protein
MNEMNKVVVVIVINEVNGVVSEGVSECVCVYRENLPYAQGLDASLGSRAAPVGRGVTVTDDDDDDDDDDDGDDDDDDDDDETVAAAGVVVDVAVVAVAALEPAVGYTDGNAMSLAFSASASATSCCCSGRNTSGHSCFLLWLVLS